MFLGFFRFSPGPWPGGEDIALMLRYGHLEVSRDDGANMAPRDRTYAENPSAQAPAVLHR